MTSPSETAALCRLVSEQRGEWMARDPITGAEFDPEEVPLDWLEPANAWRLLEDLAATKYKAAAIRCGVIDKALRLLSEAARSPECCTADQPSLALAVLLAYARANGLQSGKEGR